MLLSNKLLLTLAAAVSASNQFVLATYSPAPPGVVINQVQTSGSGCPGDGPGLTVTNDKIIVDKINQFRVSIGPNAEPGRRTRNCGIHVQITYPGGWQFMMSQNPVSGYARLDGGIAGHLYSTYFLSSDAANTWNGQYDVVGPQFGGGAGYTAPAEVVSPPDKWSGCGGNDIANFNNRIAVEGEGSGFMTVNDVQEYNILWRPC